MSEATSKDFFRDVRGIFTDRNTILFFFILLVIIFCFCPLFGKAGDSLLFFFLILVVLFGGPFFFGRGFCGTY